MALEVGRGERERFALEAALVAAGIERGDGGGEEIGDAEEAGGRERLGMFDDIARRAALHDAAGFE